MMAIVRLALKRPYTFIVAAMLVVLLGVVQIARMPVDIFPEIDVPVVSVIWQYSGVNADEMAKRVVTVSERAFTTTVNDIEHQESTSLNGVAVIKIYFQPGAKVEAAVAQLTSVTQTILRIMPPGMTPPLIIRYSASSVPILQLGLGSKTLSEQALYDYGVNFLRTQLATVQGASIPMPYGGKARQIMIDIDQPALQAKGLSAYDVSSAITSQNLILPAGTAKIGTREYGVRMNSSATELEDLANMPIKTVNGATIRVGDVATVRDGYAVQTNIVRQNGRRSTLLTVLKSGGASTLSVVDRVKSRLPQILATLPSSLEVKPLFDQSLFVKASIDGVVHEALIAGCLTAAMILLFLGSLRSTFVVAVSIPLAILCSILGLGALGQTLNVMTLGGLALAVGILVDDATVTIENIHRNVGLGKSLMQAILDGSEQILSPALVSTLSICIVFVPVFGLTGAAKSLFAPMALAVIFAMLASFVLSRTLVPVLVRYLLPAEMAHHGDEMGGEQGLLGAVHHGFMRGFEAFKRGYTAALAWALAHRGVVIAGFAFVVVGTMGLVPFLGQDFFPSVDAGSIRMHVRAPAGTRIEETEALFGRVEAAVREIVPAKDLGMVLDNVGAVGGLNMAFSDSVTQGSADGEVLVSLNHGHAPTESYVKRLRRELPKRFPEASFFFQPADIVTQILNFGLPAPIDIQVVGRNQEATYPIAKRIQAAVAKIPGAVDVHLHQIVDSPELRLEVDRTKASQLGLTQRDVANNVITALSSSAMTGPSYWLNPKNGVNYLVAVQAPQSTIGSIPSLMDLPVATGAGKAPQLLGNLATVSRSSNVAAVSHYNVQPVFDVYVSLQDRDLGGVASDVEKVLAPIRKELPKGSTIAVRGQVESMTSSFTGLGVGLAFAVVLVYFLMVINFQSWLDPFIIMMALPGGLAGIIWMLFASGTPLSVPALMGAIMSVGVATANSILVVSFANDQRKAGMDALQAAMSAGVTRLRPVMMTSLAMVIGMLPMALALGEGAEQNAPLGRAVVGGLLFATVGTLFLVPVIYSLLRKQPPVDPAMQAEAAAPHPETTAVTLTALS